MKKIHKSEKNSFAKRILLAFIKNFSQTVFKKVTEFLRLKKSNFAKFFEENGFKLLLKEFKMGLMVPNIVVLVSKVQHNVQNLKSINFCRN